MRLSREGGLSESIEEVQLPSSRERSGLRFVKFPRVGRGANQYQGYPHSWQVAMSTAVMHQQPPTPPTNELQYGLHHIARHNAGSSLHDEWPAPDDRASALPMQSNYGSPGLMQQSTDPYINELCGDDQYSRHSTSGPDGLGIQYPGYSSQSGFPPSGPNAFSGSPVCLLDANTCEQRHVADFGLCSISIR